MKKEDGETRNHRILELAQEIEKRACDGSIDFALEDKLLDVDELDEVERQELTRFEGAVAYLHKLRGKLDQINRESLNVANDPTRPDVVEKPESASQTQTQIEKTGEKIGRFEIQGVLGQGGFAQVFLARDPILDRLVALKIPKPSVLVSEESRKRFEREARAAAVLSHPNIVPVYESGSFGPVTYIASGYCAGNAMGEWFESKSREVDDRTAAAIVARLAEAVEHAHQRGVIHRDLKPGNILVESETPDESSCDQLIDQLRIADFGLARVEHLQDQTLTTAGAIIGTPAYMSPEQARGDNEIDATTDIYSLGVILYELLTGKLPHMRENQIATLKAVESQDPKSPRILRQTIPRDLEAICLKSLSKSKQDRYQSAFLLSADLQKWLDGQPIAARKIGRLQRLGRWSKRNPAIAAALSFAILSLTFGLIATGWQWRQSVINGNKADSQRRRAERHLSRLETTMDDVLRDIAITLKESPVMSSLREKVLTMALDIQTGLIEEEQDNPKIRAGTVRALLRMAEIQRMLGNFEEAEKNATQAISLIDSADSSSEHNDELRDLLVQLYEERAQNLFDQNRYGDALPVLGEGIEFAKWLETGPVYEHRYRRAQLYRMLGVALQETNEFEQAEQAYDDSLAVIGDLKLEQGFKLDYAHASTLNSKASLFKSTGRSNQAIPIFLESYEILNRLLTSQPHRPDLRKSCGLIQYNLGVLFYTKREFHSAAEHYVIALKEFSALNQINPRNENLAVFYGNALGTYASTLVKLNKIEAAKDNYNKAIQLAGDFPKSVKVQRGFLSTLNNYARFQRKQLGDSELSEATHWRVVEGCEKAIQEFPDDLFLRKSQSVAYGNLSEIYIQRKNWGRAEELSKKELEAILSAHLENPENKEYLNRTSLALSFLTRIMIRRQDLDAAFDYADQFNELDPEDTERLYRGARLHCRMYAELQSMLEDPDNDVDEADLFEQQSRVMSRGFEQLRSAIEQGFDKIEIVEAKDRIWDPFRDDPEFKAILEFMKERYDK